MKPNSSFLNFAACFSVNRPTDFPNTITSPSVGTSREPIIFKRVVLPEPLGPTNPVNSPSVNCKFTPLSAVKDPVPTGNFLTKFFTSTIVFILFSFEKSLLLVLQVGVATC